VSTSPAAAPEPRMRWWGWGTDADASHLPDEAAALVREAFAIEGEPVPRASLEDVRLPEPRLPDSSRGRLATVVGEGSLRGDRLARVAHAAGRSYPDLVRLRSGDGSRAPDAVVYPASHDEVSALLAACADERVGVVPFGGGTSVVGGVEPRRNGVDAVVSLDLARMDGLVEVDAHSLTATLEPGVTGPGAEALLGEHGLSLGHFPQSFEYGTVGGFVATRSAGQASTGYGRIDELVLGLRLASPAGEIRVPPFPASAAGPALRELLVGSEGVLGVITEATLSVRNAPSERLYEAWWFESFADGVEAFRTLEQTGAAADVSRLSDETETAMTRVLGGDAELPDGGCMVIVGWEGTGDVEMRSARGRELLDAAGARSLGRSAGDAWARGRYAGPYLRDALLDLGVMVETLETATSWSNLPSLHQRVGEALRTALEARGTRAIVLCHVSHLYRSGASLYFTFLARQERGHELEQWRTAKAAASDAIVSGGGTITHHHAIGVDHAPWMEAEVGPLGVELLRAAKERLDPGGIMNPGKLIPARQD
jgi:alkyldihydroxyacetonephosphate synthase